MPPEITLTMTEYRFELSRPVPRGRVVFRVANRGRVPHRLVLVPLPADFPPIAEQIAGTDRRNVEPLAGIPDRPPGATGAFAVDLRPGRYALVCFIADVDGRTHAQKGMAEEFRLR
ncbi:MAG TPA: hypothetical protein VM142_07265 [Acidimicrobiales bacterium]|nr:hypothetical protein [Acidimicrobiales bacterium]